MREIIFKGKRKDNGEWIEGYLFTLQEGQYMIYSPYEYGSSLSVWSILQFCSFEVIPETLGQYTGLKDKNGTKVFEGDRVKVMLKTNSPSVFCPEYMTIVWEQTGLGKFIGVDSEGDSWGISETNIEVIGNIHDK